MLTEFIGVMHFTSVTPEISWGINRVILGGPMVVSLVWDKGQRVHNMHFR